MIYLFLAAIFTFYDDPKIFTRAKIRKILFIKKL